MTDISESTENVQPVRGPLPEVGSSVHFKCTVGDASLRLGERDYRGIDFTGDIYLTVKANPGNPPGKSVQLEVTGLKFTATHEDLGQVTLDPTDVKSPDSILELVQPIPPRFRHNLLLHFQVTVEQPPQVRAGARPEPLVLRTKEPAKLLSPELSKFPPDGDFYRLENPIKLVHPDTDQVIATIDKFPVRVGG
jgi:hypothetical protein